MRFELEVIYFREIRENKTRKCRILQYTGGNQAHKAEAAGVNCGVILI